MINEDVNLKRATPADLAVLHLLCVELYSQAFGDHWEGNSLQTYLEDQFGQEQMNRDLSDKSIHYYFIQYKHIPLGFIKVNLDALLDPGLENSCELEKMYIRWENKGKGLGKTAFHLLCAKLRLAGKQSIFCGVLDTNISAIRFYEKMGFKYHSHIKLDLEGFKAHLNGLNWMVLGL